MKTVLASWIGFTDIRASRGSEKDGLGPIGQAIKAMDFGEVCLISDLPTMETDLYINWLHTLTTTTIVLYAEKLTGPTRFSEIYDVVAKAITNIRSRHGKDITLSFHLSPGTPAMAAVWIILAKTYFPARLYDSVIFECPLDCLIQTTRVVEHCMIDSMREYFPKLKPKVSINDSDPSRWNSEGKGKSIEEFLNNPLFDIDIREKPCNNVDWSNYL